MPTEKSCDMRFGILVAAVAFLVYANSLGNGFTLDDNSVILNNPVLKGSIGSLFTAIDTTGETQLLPFYRPVTYLSFFLEGRLHGFNPFLVRLLNVLLHSANTFLVYRLARSLFRDDLYAPLLAALLFAVHPLHSEGVDFNAGGRNTMLACFFCLTAYLLHNRSVIQNSIYPALAGTLLFLAGLFSKESALMILPCIVALESGTLRETCPGGHGRLRALLRLAPYLAAAGFYVIMRWLTLSKSGIQTSIIPGFGTKLLQDMYITSDLGTRLLDNIYILPRYLLTIIRPTALSPRYVIPEDLNILALPLFGAWILIFFGLIWAITKARSKATLFGLAWMVLFWLPVSGIVIVPGASLADRFLYIPAIGLWLVLADQLRRFFTPNRPKTFRYGLAACSLILLLLAALTVRRNLDWKSNFTLYSRFVAQYPDNVHARAGLGKVYYGTGKQQNMALAEDEFNKVITIDPNFPMIHTYLGNINLNSGDLNDAFFHYGKAIEVFPYDKEARLNRGITLEKMGRAREAVTDYLFFLTSPGSSDNIPGGRQHAEKRLRELSK